MKNYLYLFFQILKGYANIVKSFMLDTTVSKLKYFDETADKSLWEATLAWVVDKTVSVTHIVVVGYVLALALNDMFGLDWSWFSCSVSYWLLFKVIWSWQGDK